MDALLHLADYSVLSKLLDNNRYDDFDHQRGIATHTHTVNKKMANLIS